VGVSRQDDDHLRFLYEGNDKFAVLPTYAVIPATVGALPSLLSGNIQGFHFDPAMVWGFLSICLICHLVLQFTLNLLCIFWFNHFSKVLESFCQHF